VIGWFWSYCAFLFRCSNSIHYVPRLLIRLQMCSRYVLSEIKVMNTQCTNSMSNEEMNHCFSTCGWRGCLAMMAEYQNIIIMCFILKNYLSINSDCWKINTWMFNKISPTSLKQVRPKLIIKKLATILTEIGYR
jgi:hypothetical protein